LDKYKRQFEKCTLCVNMLNEFEDFLTDERWNEQHDISLATWLDIEASSNMRIFMDRPKAQDLLAKNNKHKKKVKPENAESGVV